MCRLIQRCSSIADDPSEYKQTLRYSALCGATHKVDSLRVRHEAPTFRVDTTTAEERS
jgi:hypothetical protein